MKRDFARSAIRGVSFLLIAGGVACLGGIVGGELRQHWGVHIDVPNRIELGTLWAGYDCKRRIPISNTGTKQAYVRKPKASCGCTAVEIGKPVLQPGEAGWIDITLDTIGKDGPFKVNVSFESNDDLEPAKSLVVSANVREFFAVDRPSLYFGELTRANLPALQSVHVVLPNDLRPEANPAATVAAIAPVDFILTEVSTALPNMTVDVNLLDSAPFGLINTDVVLRYGTAERRIPVSFRLSGEIAASPDTLFFGTMNEGEKRVLPCTIQGLPGEGAYDVRLLSGATKGVTWEKEKIDHDTVLLVSFEAPTGASLFSDVIELSLPDSKSSRPLRLHVPVIAKIVKATAGKAQPG